MTIPYDPGLMRDAIRSDLTVASPSAKNSEVSRGAAANPARPGPSGFGVQTSRVPRR